MLIPTGNKALNLIIIFAPFRPIMRSLLILFSITLSLTSAIYSVSYAQTYELGAFLGGANYIGDVGDTQFIAPVGATFGGIAKWNRSKRHSFRLTYLLGQIIADDLESKDIRRLQRGFAFENTISELSLGVEYTFWEFDLHQAVQSFTPYMYTGLTYTWYDALQRTGNLFNSVGRDNSFAIPMILGIKKTLGTKFLIGLEIGVRYSFTDALDGSANFGNSQGNNVPFGNTRNNDWYVFSGITLTYAFGRKPCYCNF